MRSLRAFFAALVLLLPLVSFAQSSSCVIFDHDLTLGDTGSDVTTLQTFLQAHGYFTATPVPNFGNATLAAVRAFQADNGISSTGTVGPLTRAAIQAKSCGTSSTTPASPPVPTTNTSGSFEISGWIPYWRTATGTADVLPHLNEITEVNPFVYTIRSDGTFLDNGDLADNPWSSFIASARAQKVRVIPTIMTSNSDLVHTLLSNTTKRVTLEDRIKALVYNNNFDGIDIDFEGKYAKDKDYFSTFLKGLAMRFPDKWVMCTVEARTPPQDAYKTVPATLKYSNDFVALNSYCDRVRFMTYDQQDAVYSLGQTNKFQLYAPLADPVWVQKVIDLASQTIKKSKIMIGIPTYGYENRVGGAVGDYTYDILWSFNPRYADQIASGYGVVTSRTSTGEMGLSYVPTTTQSLIGSDVMAATPVEQDTGEGITDGLNATSSVNQLQTAFRYLVWKDAKAISDIIALAKKNGVRGVSIFKMDGGEDQNMWTVLQGVKK